MIKKQSIQDIRKRLDDLGIPQIYEQFPADFQLDITGWSFPDDKEKAKIDVELTPYEIAELEQNGLLGKAEHVSGNTYRVRRLRTFDIEIASDYIVDAMNALKCQEFSIQSMTGGVKRCFGSRKIPECLKAKLSNKPKIHKVNFSVHAQEPPESQTHSNIPPVCDWRFLTERYESGEFRGVDGKEDREALKNEFAKLYRKTCTQRCPHCFNQEDDFYVSKIIKGHSLMKWSETKKVLRDAKRLGLESVKFLGIGELFTNPDAFKILDELREEGIHIGIFTKGTALGDDKLAKRYYADDGIETAEELVKKIAEYDNVTILLGANSFDPELQDKSVGCGTDSQCVKNYTEKRNRALQLLVKYGFNDPGKGKRLALIAAPLVPQTSAETIEMYEWGMRRNIPVVTIPTMVSGKGAGELEWLLGQFETDEELIQIAGVEEETGNKKTKEQRYTEWLVDFYTEIYSRAIEMRITDIETIKKEGISGYAGTAKCQQKHNGMYIRLSGTSQECPGRCVGAEIAEDVREQSIVTAWIGSKNYDRSKDCRSLCAVKMKDLTNSGEKVCDCCEVYDNVGSMPVELDKRVIERLSEKYQ